MFKHNVSQAYATGRSGHRTLGRQLIGLIAGTGLFTILVFTLLALISPKMTMAQPGDIPLRLEWSSAEADVSLGQAWGDYDDDGDLDLVVANVGPNDVTGNPIGQPNRLYRNDNGTLILVWQSPEAEVTASVAWGDYDGDGDLDLAVGNWNQPNRLYRNDSGVLTSSWQSTEADLSSSVAWGDYDGDGDLDLAVGNGGFQDTGIIILPEEQPNRVYLNDNGSLTNSAVWSSAEVDATASVAWADYDGNGTLDLAVGNVGAPPFFDAFNRLYRNDGGTLVLDWTSIEQDITLSVAWGDYDGDGDPDLAVGNADLGGGQANRLYRNDGGTLTSIWTSPEIETTASLAWGDFDSDGDLDLAAGNASPPFSNDAGQRNRLYLNDAGLLTSGWEASETDDTLNVAWADYDGDGDLDLAAGNANFSAGQVNRLYRNDSGTLPSSESWASIETETSTTVAWGDYDQDGDLDLAVGNFDQPIRLYRNESGTLTPIWQAPIAESTFDLAWGDYDGNGDLDLAVGNWGQPNRLYSRSGETLTSIWQSAEASNTESVAWADYDGDGDLDLAVGNAGQSNQIYRNDGGTLAVALILIELENTSSLAWGDYDGDGDPDLVVGNSGQPSRLYRNDGQSFTSVWQSNEAGQTSDVAWADYDGDGDLDLAVGEHGPNRLYRNDNGQLTAASVWESVEADITLSMAWGDYDGDGDLDLVAGNGGFFDGTPIGQLNRLYRNDHGLLTTKTVWEPANSDTTASIAWGDYDGDGDLDLLAGNVEQPNYLYRNTRDNRAGLASIPVIRLSRPAPPANANFYSSSEIWSAQTIALSYTLIHSDSLPVRWISGTFSLDGGDHWLPATPAAGTITTDLGASPSGVNHIYQWDVRNSGVMGQSNNVVFRLVAAPALTVASHQIPGPFLYGAYGTSTFPFRVRGSQVRVLSGTTPISAAVVYRLSDDQAIGGQPFADLAGVPFRTDNQGYLQGRGQIDIGDRLLALAPIPLPLAYTNLYSTSLNLNYTNAAPTEIGLDTDTVDQTGVQTLTVSADNPLLLFDLEVALEWDAHNDSTYLDQLKFDLQKASQHLYDFSDGQAALGEIVVSQNADDWIFAHLDVHATNRLRPYATIGGVVLTDTVDPQHPDIVNGIGQIHMGATWNRYGNPGQSLGEDWPLILAHELGHYLFFLDDTYLGLNEDDLLIAINECGSAMGDVYNVNNTEFLGSGAWLPACQDTLAHKELARSEWETIELWYPWLKTPTSLNTGPGQMPFQLTTVQILDPITPSQTLVDPTFFLDYQNGEVGSSEARAYLLRNKIGTSAGGPDDYEYIYDLGNPVGGQNRLLARGAQPGDRLCVFDQPRAQYGCEIIENGDERLALEQDPTWTPVVQISPVNSTTFTLQVEDLPGGLNVMARLYPEFGSGGAGQPLPEVTSGVYSGPIQLDDPALTGDVLVWVVEPAQEFDPRRETIVTYSIGGNPGNSRGGGGNSRGGGGNSRGGGGNSRGGGGNSRGGGAPVVSADGQMIFFDTSDISFDEGQFYTVQNMASLPPLPDGKLAIGQGYNLFATGFPVNNSVLTGSITFQYLGDDVLIEGKSEDELSIHFWDGAQWRTLATHLDTTFNLASASSQGAGIYALLAGVTTPIITAIVPEATTNEAATMLTINGANFLPPVEVSLVGPTATHNLSPETVSPTSITVVVPQGLPAREYQVWVSNGNQPGGAATSPIPGIFALFDPAQACFYDFFESGAGQWQRSDDWDIVILPDGERAMTDSPLGPYKNSGDYGSGLTAHTTAVTSVAFNLNDCPNPTLTFRHAYILAKVGDSQDTARIEVSTDDGATWTELASYSGGGIFDAEVGPLDVSSPEWANVNWQPVALDLSPYSGPLRLRFSLEVDESVSDKGWVFDNLMVRSGPATQLYLPIIRKAE